MFVAIDHANAVKLVPHFPLLNCVVLQAVADLEQRLHAAEARHQDLSVKLPEATRPLLQQMEAMQAAAAAQEQAWAAAEQAMQVGFKTMGFAMKACLILTAAGSYQNDI